MHDTSSRRRARELKREAERLERDARLLVQISGMEMSGGARRCESEKLRDNAARLELLARLEDLSVRQVDYWKQSRRTGELNNFPRWIASWREGNGIRTVYLGSVKKLSQTEALEKAREMKRRFLEVLGCTARP